MPDAAFADPRLAALYDAFNGDRVDLAAYAAIADELAAERVLDLGCGTGTLAILLAATGRQVIGVDPASASLDIARTKPDADRVTWLEGNASRAPAADADLVLMTGNVAQVFLTDDHWSQTLLSVREGLRSGGTFVFETRRPERRAWEEWACAEPITRDVPGIGPVQRRLESLDVHEPLVSFRYAFHFLRDGTVLTSDSTLRFRSRSEVEDSLLAAGFQVLDVREAPDRPGREYVFIAGRT